MDVQESQPPRLAYVTAVWMNGDADVCLWAGCNEAASGALVCNVPYAALVPLDREFDRLIGWSIDRERIAAEGQIEWAPDPRLAYEGPDTTSDMGGCQGHKPGCAAAVARV